MHSQFTHFCRPSYFTGLDVHRATIVACVYDSETRRPCFETEFWTRPPIKLSRFAGDVHRKYGVCRACYEASSDGYVLHEDLRELGMDCAVIAPGSIPKRSEDPIKTDQRDSRKLVEHIACGLLTECFFPDREFESTRGCVFRAKRGTDSERSGAPIRAKWGTNPSEAGHQSERSGAPFRAKWGTIQAGILGR